MASSCQTLCLWVPGATLSEAERSQEAAPVPGQLPQPAVNNLGVPPPGLARNSNTYNAGGGGGGGSYQPGIY